MRDADNMRDVAALGIDWMGMIFWQRSPRYVSTIPTAQASSLTVPNKRCDDN